MYDSPVLRARSRTRRLNRFFAVIGPPKAQTRRIPAARANAIEPDSDPRTQAPFAPNDVAPLGGADGGSARTSPPTFSVPRRSEVKHRHAHRMPSERFCSAIAVPSMLPYGLGSLTSPGCRVPADAGGTDMKGSTFTTTAVAVRPVLFTPEEELGLVGFLAGYSGLTRDAYAVDLRQYVAWCTERNLALFGARRSDIETFSRHLESLGRARATIARRLCTIAAFYRYAEEEGLITTARGARPTAETRLRVQRHRLGPQRVGAILVVAGLAGARDHGLISLLTLNGLRVSEATGADIEALGLERGHRTLTIVRKGGRVVTVPLAPRTARAIDLAVGERCEGPIFLSSGGERLDRHAAGRIVRRIARRAGITKRVGPHTLRHTFITAALDAGVPLATCKKPPATPPANHHALRPRSGLPRSARYLHRRDVPRRRSEMTNTTSARESHNRSRAGYLRWFGETRVAGAKRDPSLGRGPVAFTGSCGFGWTNAPRHSAALVSAERRLATGERSPRYTRQALAL